MSKKRTLHDEYRFSGFRPEATVRGVFGEPSARVLRLHRTQKKRNADAAVRFTVPITTRKYIGCAIFRVAVCTSIWTSKYVAFDAGCVEP